MSRIFGDVRQNGYVVPDIEAALDHWTRVLRVGPFYYFDRVLVEEFQYRGEPSPLEVSIALANSGALQIELIQQRNDAPSMYRDFLSRESRGGLQHVAYWTETFDADMARLGAEGFEVGQSGRIGVDGRFAYFDTESTTESPGESPVVMPGTIVELSEISGDKGRFFARLAQKAAGWDGRKAVIGR